MLLLFACQLFSILAHIMKNRNKSIAKLKTLLHYLFGLSIFTQQKDDKVISQHVVLRVDFRESKHWRVWPKIECYQESKVGIPLDSSVYNNPWSC